MLTPQTLSRLPDPLVDLINELQMEIIKSIAEKLTKANYLTPSAEWQLYKAQQLRLSTAEVNKLLMRYTKLSQREIRSIYTDACKQAISNDAAIYRQFGRDASSYFRSVAFSNALKAGIKNANGLFENFTRSTVQSSRKTVTHLMDKAYLQVLSGAFSPQEAIYSAVKELANKGIQSVTYPSGRTDWADVAVRRAVITGIGQTTGQMQLDLAAEMGTDLVEVTSHMGARPSHAEWQGKVYSISGKSKKYPSLRAATGYGRGDGLKGWNCRHDFFPFFEGLSERANLPVDLKENEKQYKAEQKQRAIERSIRKSKRGLAALDSSIRSTDDEQLKAKLRSDFDRKANVLKRQEAKLTEHCEANDLLPRNDRTRVVGFGRSVSQKAVHGNKRYAAKKSGGQSGNSGRNSQTKLGKPNESKQLRDTIFESDGKPNKPLANLSVDNSSESGIIDVKKIKVEDFTEEQNNKLHEAHKNLLEQLKDKVFGTEISAVYDLDMEHIIIDDVGYFVGKAGECNAPFVDPGIPFISVHNHPSNSHLGIEDLMLFGECDNCIAISSVGNTGKPVHLILKTDEFDCKGFYSCIVDRCENLRIYDNRSFKEIDSSYVSNLSEIEKEDLFKALDDFLLNTSKECEKYGIKNTY